MVDKIIGLRPDGTLNPETIAAVKEIAGTGIGSVTVTDDGAGTYTVGGTTIKGLTTQGQLPAAAKKYVDDGLAGKANTTHTHAWTEVTGKPTTFTPATHNHTAAQITTGTLDPARLPLSTTATAGAMSPADKTKLDGITGTDPDLTAAVTAGKAAAEKKAAYDAAVAAQEAAQTGTVLIESDMEDSAVWTPSYVSWIYEDTSRARSGTKMLRLPANNSNTALDKPAHAYLRKPGSVTSGKQYMIRAWVRSLGTVGDDDYFRVMIGTLSGTTVTYLAATNKVMTKAAGMNPNTWVRLEVPWTATTTTTNLVIGAQAGFMDSDVLVDDIHVADITDTTDLTAQVTAAREEYTAAKNTATTAWAKVLPEGVGSGGSSNMVSITRAEYDALAVKDPNIIYLITV